MQQFSAGLAYFYCFAGQPWKTQAMIRRILKEQYDATPGGLNGNEDCGQMSAWYILSALGFYSVCPGQTAYVIGSPLFDKAVLKLDNGKTFTVSARANGSRKPYIQNARLNGQPWNDYLLDHATLVAGGELEFQMGARPQKDWGLAGAGRPAPEIRVSGVPYLTQSSGKFLDRFNADMRCDDPKAEIRYTLDGSTPNRNSERFTTPFDVSVTTELKMRTYTEGAAPSLVVSRTLTRSEPLVPAAPPLPGLKYAYYEGIYRSVYDFAKDTPVATGVVDQPTVEVRRRNDWIGLVFDGLIQIPQEGEYTFYLAAKDGGQLLLDSEEQFESDGRKDEALPQQSILALRAGFHRFTVKFYKCTDKISLAADWSGPGFARTAIPQDVLFHARE